MACVVGAPVTPLVFALVDAVLYGRMAAALRIAISPATNGTHQRAFNEAAESWNWWRSLWGVL